jgi:methyl-accepting chemotaxis protein
MVSKLANMEKLLTEQKDKDIAREIKDNLATYDSGFNKVYSMIQAGEIQTSQAANTAIGQYKDAIHKIENLSGKVFEAANTRMDEGQKIVESSARKIKIIMFIITLVSIALGLLISVLIANDIIRPLNEAVTISRRISKGDLSVNIQAAGSDEIGHLFASMKEMSQSLRSTIAGIIKSADNVGSTVDVLGQRAEETTEGAQNQSGQAAQIATAAEEMSQTITDIARNASVASETSAEAMDTASKGKDVADGAVETVGRVYSSTVELATMVEKLNNRAGEIGDIVTVIKDIADQTNLLALNAAIEAARAGEQGRGFAVVADEVRKLAERTIKATTEISDKIGAVQAESEQTMKSMGKASEEVTKATEYIRQVGDSLNHIVDSVQKVRDQITQIAIAVDEQSAASEEVARNIEKTSGIARDMERMSDDVKAEVKKLVTISEELHSSTSGFVIG